MVTSDHAPLTLRFRKIENTRSRTFRFENHWLISTEAKEIIHQAWHSIQSTSNITKNLLWKFAKIRRELTSWAQTKYRGLKHLLQRTKHIIKKLDITEEKRDLTNPELKLRIDLCIHAHNLAEIQETKWKQRSCVN
jgi:hypothetical protein